MKSNFLYQNKINRFFIETQQPFSSLRIFLFLLIFSSCQYFKPALEKNNIVAKKVWIRETFKKDFIRPSVFQPIKPVIHSSAGLLVQGNKTTGVKAYTLYKGKMRWFFPIKGGLAGHVLVSDDKVFFGGADGFMYSLHGRTGKILWKFYTGMMDVSEPVIHKARLYFVGSDKIYCLNAQTGALLWSYSALSAKQPEFSSAGVAAPLIGSSLIYFKTGDGSLIALNLKGRLKWRKKLADTGRFADQAGAPIMGQRCLYVSGGRINLYCLNKSTGAEIWKTAPGTLSHLKLFGSLLFYPTADGRIQALDQKSGKLVWSHHTIDRVLAGSPVVYKDWLIYGEYSGALRFISIKTGKLVYSFAFGSGMSASPALSVMDSELYFMSNSGWLYKLSLKTSG